MADGKIRQAGKRFRYVARARDGSIRRGDLEAADRNEALRRLKDQGLTPLGVTEAQPQGGPSSRFGLTRRELAIMAVALVVIVGAVAVRLTGTGKAVSPERAQAAPAAGARPGGPTASFDSPPEFAAHAAPAQTASGAAAELDAAVPAAADTPAPQPGPPRRERRVRQFIPPGGTNSMPPLFQTQTEQVLAYFASAQLGDMPPPPLPDVYKREDIATILDTDIVVYETDADDINTIKVDVAHAKHILKQYMAQGGTMEEFLDYYQEEMAKAYRERQEAQRNLMERVRAGDAAGALDYFAEQNALFEEKGIIPLILPPQLRRE